MKYVVVVALIFLSNSLFAQYGDVSILLLGGYASSSDAIGMMDSNLQNQCWKSGPKISAAVEVKIIGNIFGQCMLSYSTHSYKGVQTADAPVKNPSNRYTEVFFNIKWKMGIVHIVGGAGISNQHSDAVKTRFYDSPLIIEEREKMLLGGLLGLGFDIHIYDRINLLVEGDLNFREYFATSSLLGMRYAF